MGKVSIKVSNDRLQLVFTHQRQRHYLSLGLPDSARNRKIAELKAARIEEDILFDRFEGLDKYRDRVEEGAPEPQAMTLDILWDRYLEHKRTECKPSTMANQYRDWSRNLTNCPHSWDAPLQMRQWGLKELTQDSCRRWLGALSACCEWGIKARLIEMNPFSDLKLAKVKTATDDADIDPFTVEERDLIIQKFSESKYYKGYTPFIKFLFWTGCRPSEAIGLEWSHVTKTHITFQQAATLNEQGQLRISEGLKTQKKRRIEINDRLAELLNSLDKSTKYVFPSPRGGLIDFHNFTQRAWVSILKECDLKYRKPYQTRHTFATLSLRSGVEVADLAKILGNSPEIIYKHYAAANRQIKLPIV